MNPESTPIIHVVEDDVTQRSLMQRVIEDCDLEVASYPSAEAFLERFDSKQPGCVVLDVYLPGMSGVDLLRRLRQDRVSTPVLVLTGQADVPMALDALKLGAADFLLKPVRNHLLAKAVQEAVAKDAKERVERDRENQIVRRLETLTQRELEVIKLVVEGNPNKVVAARLGLSPKTVEVHRGRAMKKMKARSLPDLVRMTLRVEHLDILNVEMAAQ